MNATTTRRAALAALAVAATAAIPAGAFAQAAYPNKTVTIVVPFAAGGTTDILARIIGQALTTELGTGQSGSSRSSSRRTVGDGQARQLLGRLVRGQDVQRLFIDEPHRLQQTVDPCLRQRPDHAPPSSGTGATARSKK